MDGSLYCSCGALIRAGDRLARPALIEAGCLKCRAPRQAAPPIDFGPGYAGDAMVVISRRRGERILLVK